MLESVTIGCVGGGCKLLAELECRQVGKVWEKVLSSCPSLSLSTKLAS